MKRGIQCPGYDQYRIFLHNTSATQSEEKKKKKPAGSKQSFALQTQTQPQYLSRARPVTIQQPTTVHNGPSKREQLFSVYVNTYFPENVLGSTELDPWYSLLSGVSAIPNKPIMLEKAIAAKACIFLGRANNDNSMFHHGLQLYNSAIHHMSIHLNRKRNIYSDELVYTVAVFQQLVVGYLPCYFSFHLPELMSVQSCHCPHGLEVWLDQVKVTNGILKYCHNRASHNPIIKKLYVAFHRMRLVCRFLDISSDHTDPCFSAAIVIATARKGSNRLGRRPVSILCKVKRGPVGRRLITTPVGDFTLYHCHHYDCGLRPRCL